MSDEERSWALYTARSRALIEEYGHMVQGVFPAKGDSSLTVPFGYTIGLTDTHKFELAVSGPFANSELTSLLNTVAEKVKDGELVPSVMAELPGIFEHPLRFRRTAGHSDWRPLGMLIGDVPEVWQMVWADSEGRYPSEPGYAAHAEQDML